MHLCRTLKSAAKCVLWEATFETVPRETSANLAVMDTEATQTKRLLKQTCNKNIHWP